MTRWISGGTSSNIQNLDADADLSTTKVTTADAAVANIVAAVLPDVMASTDLAVPDPLPLPRLLSNRDDGTLEYATVRVDPSGRVADRAIFQAAYWSYKQRLSLHVTNDVIVFTADENGIFSTNSKGLLHIPAAARHTFSITQGSRVLLAAATRYNAVVVYPLSTLDRAIANFHRDTNGT